MSKNVLNTFEKALESQKHVWISHEESLEEMWSSLKGLN